MALTDNIVSYWKFDESSGNASDSAESNTLTNNNSISYVSGKINNGADLDLSLSQYFSVADNVSLSLTSAISFSCWVKLEQLPSTTGTIMCLMSKNRESTNQRGITIDVPSSNKLQIFTSSTGTYSAGTTTETFSSSAIFVSGDVGNWVHIVSTYVASTKTFHIYKNGSEVSNTKFYSNATSIYDNTASFVIGADNEGTNRYLDGVIDEVGIWSRVLSSSEVTELYNSGAGLQYPFPSLVKGGTLSMMGV